MATSGQTEALKLISEWCKWTVTVESAAIGLIVTILDRNETHLLRGHIFGKVALITTIFSFVASIVCAGTIVSAIPTAIADINEGERVLDREIYVINRSVGPIWMYSEILFGTFLFGIIGLAVTAISLVR